MSSESSQLTGHGEFEHSVLVTVVKAFSQVNLEAILVGNAAAAVQGIPQTLQVLEFFLRDTEKNREKLKQALKNFGPNVRAYQPFEPSSNMMRIEGLPADVDLIFQLSSRVRFELLKSRSLRIQFDDVQVQVSQLRDIIDAKQAAGRPKDLATLPILEQALRVEEQIRKVQEREK